MKKVALSALIAFTLLFLAGCSTPDAAAIEGGVWKMSTVQQGEAKYAPQGSENLYTVTFEEGSKALASYSKTRYAAGKERDTLSVSTNEYALTFYLE